MPPPKYTISKLLPLVLLSSCMSVATVFVFRFIALNPLYHKIAQYSSYSLPALIAIPLLIILFYLFAAHLNSGLAHVVLQYHIGSGRLPLLNFMFQWLSASVALLLGFAVGAIGPAVHIGASSANLVGQFFQAQRQTLRILTACGASVAITIMLDTPLMAILFTYETIIRQFRWRTLALVAASTIFAQSFGHQMGISAFHMQIPAFEFSLSLCGLLLLFGLLCGLLSATYLNCIDFLAQKIRANYWVKIAIAGVLTAFFSTLAPTTIGLGVQLLNELLYEPQLIGVLLLWFFIRFVGSIVVIALAIPGGALSPTLILGALTGAIFSQLLSIESAPLFMLVGMGAFLGSTLCVPLAGILFVLESSNEISLLLPCIITSYSAFYLHQRLSKHHNLIELLLFRQKAILRDSPSLKKKRPTSPL